jgi:hypothetical protein
LANSALDTSNSYNESYLAPDFPVWDAMVREYVKKLVIEKVI